MKANSDMNRELGKFIDGATVDNLVEAARAATRRRKNLNLHPELADPIRQIVKSTLETFIGGASE